MKQKSPPLALEPRVLLDGASELTVDELTGFETNDLLTGDESHSVEEQADLVAALPAQQPVRLLVVDSRAAAASDYVSRIGANDLLIQVSADDDGIAKVSEAVAQQSISSIEIVTADVDDITVLGTSRLSLDGVDTLYRGDISSWSEQLTEEATITFRGVDAPDVVVLDKIAMFTGARVTAGVGEPLFDTDDETQPLFSPETLSSSTELLFIDSRVPDIDYLTTNSRAGIEVIIISESEDGLERISSELAARPSIESIHLVSHGSAGSLTLGSATANLGKLTNPFITIACQGH
jgi:hypothetical protein